MIADPNRHIENETLRELLDDNLANEQVVAVESHLSGCDRCRDELEQLAGDPRWWSETVDVLSKSTVGSPRRERRDPTAEPRTGDSSWEVDSSLEWIRPLLEESGESRWGRLDQYPIDGLIGQGGMGVVLRGVDPELNRPVAIKILSPHLAGVGAARARFMREAQAAAAIVHPSIVPIYSIATAARLPYIVMPLIAGGNLQERIDREGPLGLAELLRIGLQISEGLAAAHRQGVIHRDIKPANILVEEGNGRVLISDFGLARALDDATLTMSGMIAGTPQYMSPEQSRGEVVDERTDLFSLGSLIYALAIGRPPFRAETPLAVLRKICDGPPRPIHQINEQMPPWLDRLVAKLMTIDRSVRVPTAVEAAGLLRDSLTHVRHPSRQPLPAALSQQRRPTRNLAIAATAVGTALLGGAAIWAAVNGNGVPDSPVTSSEPRTGSGNRSHVAPLDVGRRTDANVESPVGPSFPDHKLGEMGAGVGPTIPSKSRTTRLADSEWSGVSVSEELAAVNVQISALTQAMDREGQAIATESRPVMRTPGTTQWKVIGEAAAEALPLPGHKPSTASPTDPPDEPLVIPSAVPTNGSVDTVQPIVSETPQQRNFKSKEGNKK